MPKDARLVSTIVGIWDINSFLRIPNSASTMNSVNTQALPPPRVSKPRKRARVISSPDPPDLPPIINARPPSNGRQSARKSTGGKSPDVRRKLLAKVARR